MSPKNNKHKHHQKHTHQNGMLSIDIYAQSSRLRCVSPVVKILFILAVLIFSVLKSAANINININIIISMTLFIIFLCKIPFNYFIYLIKIPTFFILISCIAIAFNIRESASGILNIFLFRKYLSITLFSLNQALILFLQAYAAVTCLYFLSLSTPVQEIIYVLKMVHIPDIIIELMYLIYRYIFVLLDMQNKMTISAKSRLGYSNYKSSWYTFTHISGNLLSSSFRRSGACFDAMEARCYEGRLNFITNIAPVKLKHVLLCCAYFLMLALIYYFF